MKCYHCKIKAIILLKKLFPHSDDVLRMREIDREACGRLGSPSPLPKSSNTEKVA